MFHSTIPPLRTLVLVSGEGNMEEVHFEAWLKDASVKNKSGLEESSTQKAADIGKTLHQHFWN